MPRKTLSIFIILCFIFAAAIGSSSAAENKTREKLDVVFVLDASGSMRESDPNRMTADAVKMMVSMMPAGDCRVGIVSFNIEPKVRTRDIEGRDALISLEYPEDTEYIKDRLDQIDYMDDTGIGNALFRASGMLEQLSDPDSRKAIILFTDGMDDLEDRAAMQDCLENEQKAVEWAKENNCPIYCVGLDFEGSSGVSSLGENGEGIKKLGGIADPTGGFARATADIQKIEELFIDILANIFSIYYNEAVTVPVGGDLESIIKINPNVNEANIRISGAGSHGVRQEQIALYSPDGVQAALDSAGIRLDSDNMSSNIKIALPKAGEWKLVLSGSEGTDVRVGHLEHYYLDIHSVIEFSGADPNVLHPNEEAVITACLTSGGEPVTDEAVNDAVITANAHVVPRSEPEKAFDVELVRRDASFCGSFMPEKADDYDVEVTLGTNSFYRTESVSVKCEGLPAVNAISVIEAFPDIELEAGGKASVNNVLSHIDYVKGSGVTVTAELQGGGNSAKISYDPASDTLFIEGLAGGEAVAKLTFTDPSGTAESVSFRITVPEPEPLPQQQPKPSFDPAVLLYAAAGAAAFSVAAYALYKNRNAELKGYILLSGISYRSGDANSAITASYNEFGDILEDFVFSTGLFSDKKDRNLACLLSETAEKLESSRNSDQKIIYEFLTSESGRKMLKEAKKVRLEGSLKGSKGLFFVCPAGNRFVFINGKSAGKFNLDVGSNLEVMILSDPGINGGTSLALELEYKKIMRRWTRTFVAPED